MVRQFEFRGVPYQVMTQEGDHASGVTFEDESTVRDAMWTVGEGDLILDVGSAFGSYTLTALAAGASHVHAFNPLERENGLLRQSLELNGWSDRVTIWEVGVHGSPGWFNPDTPEFRATEFDGAFPVRAVSDVLDDAVGGLSVIGPCWMKLDVEGAEEAVLRSAAGFIRRWTPRVLVETHDFKVAGCNGRVREAMESYDGYRHVRTDPYHGVSHSLYVHDG